MAFGPNSTNPRERRAYAHTLRDKALASGEPEDKITALEAANDATNTRKGEGLAWNTFSAFRNQDQVSLHELMQAENVTDTGKGKSISWTRPEFARRHEAVIKMIGTTGVKLTKLHTDEDYMRAANMLVGNRPLKDYHPRHDGGYNLPNAEQLANYGIHNDMTLVEHDHTVPGSLFAGRAVQVLASRPLIHKYLET